MFKAYRELQKKFAADKREEEESLGEYGLYYQEKNKRNKEEFEEDEDEPYVHPDIRHTAPQHRYVLGTHSLRSFIFDNQSEVFLDSI